MYLRVLDTAMLLSVMLCVEYRHVHQVPHRCIPLTSCDFLLYSVIIKMVSTDQEMAHLHKTTNFHLV